EANFLGGFACEIDGRPVELDLREVLLMDSAVALAREIVGQINHEAVIAAGCPPADPLRVDQRNRVAWPALRQPAGCRQARESGADDDPIGRLRTLELPRGSRLVEDLIPARALEISREAAGMILGHAGNISPSSRWRQDP